MTQPNSDTLSQLAPPIDASPEVATPAGRLLEARRREFRSNFNVRSFMFQHNLSGDPLFELSRLATLRGT